MNQLIIFILLFFMLPVKGTPTISKPVKILTDMRFTEGPAISPEGVLFFTDVPEQIIYRYDFTSQNLDTFLTQTGGANGLYFDSKGCLIACAGRARQLLSITPDGKICITTDNAVDVYSPGKELLHRFMFEVQTTKLVYHNHSLCNYTGR